MKWYKTFIEIYKAVLDFFPSRNDWMAKLGIACQNGARPYVGLLKQMPKKVFDYWVTLASS